MAQLEIADPQYRAMKLYADISGCSISACVAEALDDYARNVIVARLEAISQNEKPNNLKMFKPVLGRK